MRTACILALCLAAIGGKAFPAAAADRPVLSLKEIRNHGVVRQKWDLSCGAAALATLLTYQMEDPVPEVDIAKTMLRHTDPLKVKVRLGFSLLDLKNFVEGRGFQADGYGDVTMADLDEMAPVIVPINAHGYDHFLIYRGRIGDRVVLADPAFGNRSMPVTRFEDMWELKVAFQVKHRDEVHAPNHMAPQAADIVSPSAQGLRQMIH